MSPEQAAFALVKDGESLKLKEAVESLGPATDVYGLGAILFALLTGQPPVEGKTTEEILDRVRQGKIRQPRSLNPNIPRALEAVCLKALAEKPEDRYPSALALADDVERWLADEPVSVYRDPWTTRLLRWRRKHRAKTMTAAGILFTALVATAVVAAIKTEDNRLLRLAYGNLATANGNLTKSLEREQRLRTDVESRYGLAKKAIEAFHTGVSDDVHLKNPELKDLRDRLLHQAIDFYKQLSAILKESDAPEREKQSELAETYHQLAILIGDVGSPRDALAATEETLRLYEDLAQAVPSDERFVINQATMHHNIGIILRNTGDLDGALKSLETASKLLMALPSAIMKNALPQSALARVETAFGIIQGDLGHHREAMRHYESAREIRTALLNNNPDDAKNRAELAHVLTYIGSLNKRLGAMAESLQGCEEAVRLLRGLCERYPDVRDFQFDLAESLDAAGLCHASLGRPEKALALHREALDIHKVLANAYPTITSYRMTLADGHSYLADALWTTGQFKDAFLSHQEVIKIRKRSVEEQPSVPAHRANLAQAYVGLGELLSTLDQHDEAVSALRSGLGILEAVTRENAKIVKYRIELAQTKWTLATTLSQDPRRRRLHPAEFAEGIALQVEATDDIGVLADEFPEIPDYQNQLEEGLRTSGRFIGERHAESGLDLLHKARKIRENLLEKHPETPFHQFSLVVVYRDIGDVLKGGDDRHRPHEEQGLDRTEAQIKEAQVYYEKARDLLRVLIRKHPLDPTYRSELGAVLNNHAIVLCLDFRNHEKALGMYEEAFGHQSAAYEMAPRNFTYRTFLRNHLIGMVRVSRSRSSLRCPRDITPDSGPLARRPDHDLQRCG